MRLLAWKIFTFYFIASTLYFDLAPGLQGPWDIADLAVLFIGFAGMLGFSYRRPIFRPLFWRIYLPLNILWNVWHPDATAVPGVPGVPFWLVLAIGITAAIPFYIALFLYAFRRPKLWQA